MLLQFENGNLFTYEGLLEDKTIINTFKGISVECMECINKDT